MDLTKKCGVKQILKLKMGLNMVCHTKSTNEMRKNEILILNLWFNPIEMEIVMNRHHATPRDKCASTPCTRNIGWVTLPSPPGRYPNSTGVPINHPREGTTDVRRVPAAHRNLCGVMPKRGGWGPQRHGPGMAHSPGEPGVSLTRSSTFPYDPPVWYLSVSTGTLAASQELQMAKGR